MSRVLCTIAHGPHRALHALTGPALERYARRHGYELVVVHERLTGRPAAWDKVVLLHSLVARHDFVVWIDADALVSGDAPDIAHSLRADRELHLVEHRTARGRVPNTGVLAVRGGAWSSRFLEHVWSQRQFVDDRWWENAAVNHLLGYRHVGSTRRLVPSSWRRRVGQLHHAWNSIPEDSAARPHVWHFPGLPLPVREQELQRVAALA